MKVDQLRVKEEFAGSDKNVYVSGSYAGLRMLQIAIKQALELGVGSGVTVAVGRVKLVVRNESIL